jgi:sugar/nucleoside kinase (ribokinase family)
VSRYRRWNQLLELLAAEGQLQVERAAKELGGAAAGAAGLDLLIVGDCNPDVVVTGADVTPAFGQQEKLVDGISLVIGGSASITAVAAARLGLRVGLAAAVGADAAGEFMLARLAAEGVDTSAMVVRPDHATAMTVVLSRGSDRAILTALGSMPTLTAADVRPAVAALAARSAGPRHLHVSSYFLLERSLGPELAALFAAARSAGVTTSLDTNWDPDQRWGDENLRTVLAETDLLMPNEAEALHLSGKDEIGDAVRGLAAAGPRVVVKLGSQGAVAADASSWHRAGLPAGLGAGFVDAIGAGDCFNAGVLAGLLRGLDLAAAMAVGCAVGSASTRAAGGTGTHTDLAAALDLAKSVPVSPVPLGGPLARSG